MDAPEPPFDAGTPARAPADVTKMMTDMFIDFNKQAGMSHGAWCLGCCWALMSVLVVVGVMNLVWMAALALVFLLEKNWRHGVAVSRVAGASVALLGILVFVQPQVLRLLAGLHA